MGFFFQLIYLTLKVLVWGIYRIFYSKITIINQDRLRFEHPAIVISNHPSTLMDPLSVASRIPRRVAFLANAGLFRNKAFGAFLKIYCIPVERPKDVKGRQINNTNSFARADQHLAEQGCIYIAAEGTSVVERRLRKLKTGTARIALSAESKKDFSLGLTIVPVGLSYSSPLEFRSEVLLYVGEPVPAKDYKQHYEEQPFVTAKKLTSDLQDRMQSLVFHTETEAEDELLTQVQTVLQSDKPLAPEPHFLRSRKALDQILTLSEKEFGLLKKNADDYFSTLAQHQLKDLSLVKQQKPSNIFLSILKLIVGLPLFLYGWVNNFFAFFVPGFLAHQLNIFHGYIPTVKVLAGLVFLPFFFYLQTKLVSHYIDIPYIGWIYLLTLLPMGWIAWEYRDFALQFFQDRKANAFQKKSRQQFNSLVEKREHFLQQMKTLGIK